MNMESWSRGLAPRMTRCRGEATSPRHYPGTMDVGLLIRCVRWLLFIEKARKQSAAQAGVKLLKRKLERLETKYEDALDELDVLHEDVEIHGDQMALMQGSINRRERAIRVLRKEAKEARGVLGHLAMWRAFHKIENVNLVSIISFVVSLTLCFRSLAR